jgi:hypothetical protein
MRIHIRALIGAAQERPLYPDELLEELNNCHWGGQFPDIRNVLLPLRYEQNIISNRGEKNGTYPCAIEYVTALLHDRWTIRGVVSLGQRAQPWLMESGFSYIEIPESASLPGSVVAAQVRSAFGWV